jgi:hypothetical protein
VKKPSGCKHQLEKSTTNAHESDTAMQEPFQVSSMAVLYLYKETFLPPLEFDGVILPI